MERELLCLLGQIAQARAVLEELHRQIAAAQKNLAQGDSTHMAEVNGQLIATALQHQTKAEEAAQALGELSKSHALDPLTQLPNRLPLMERFQHSIASAQRHRNRMAVLFIDIDDFKGTNDAWGHAMGDEVLRHAARCISGSVRDIDFVCRYGGDEFVVLVTDVAQPSDAALVARKIALATAAPFTAQNRTVSVSLSIGVCVYPDDGADTEALLCCADAAMYEAKRLKKNEQAGTRIS